MVIERCGHSAKTVAQLVPFWTEHLNNIVNHRKSLLFSTLSSYLYRCSLAFCLAYYTSLSGFNRCYVVLLVFLPFSPWLFLGSTLLNLSASNNTDRAIPHRKYSAIPASPSLAPSTPLLSPLSLYAGSLDAQKSQRPIILCTLSLDYVYLSNDTLRVLVSTKIVAFLFGCPWKTYAHTSLPWDRCWCLWLENLSYVQANT